MLCCYFFFFNYLDKCDSGKLTHFSMLKTHKVVKERFELVIKVYVLSIKKQFLDLKRQKRKDILAMNTRLYFGHGLIEIFLWGLIITF